MLQMEKEEKTVTEKVGFILKTIISAAGSQIYNVNSKLIKAQIMANKVTPKIN